jgi:hypothetical protein
MGETTLSLMTDGTIRESKLLWVLGNYSRFVRPGMVRVKCDIAPEQSHKNGVLVSAYRGAGRGLTLVVVNLSDAVERCDLGFAGTVNVYTTSANTNLERSRQDATSIVLPARAVATVLIE